MNYKKADVIFPEDLLKEVQKYVNGEFIYIPRTSGNRKKWGEKSGNKEYLANRNKEIYIKYKEGYTIEQLLESYFLSYESIKKIIYSQR